MSSRRAANADAKSLCELACAWSFAGVVIALSLVCCFTIERSPTSASLLAHEVSVEVEPGVTGDTLLQRSVQQSRVVVGEDTGRGRNVQDDAIVDPPEILILFCAECNDYMDWQTVVLHRSWKKAGAPGRLVRVLACSNESIGAYRHMSDLGDGMETFVHEPTGLSLDYPPLNRPIGILAYLTSDQGRSLSENATILMVDPDMVFRTEDAAYTGGSVAERLLKMGAQLRTSPTQALATDYGYPIKGMRATDWAVPRHFNFTNFSQLQGVGHPMVHRKANLLALCPIWYNVTRDIVRSPDLLSLVRDDKLPAPWIAEMYGYILAAAFLRHQTQEVWPELDAVQPPYTSAIKRTKSRDPSKSMLVHYSHRFSLCGRRFGKADHYSGGLLDCASREIESLEPPPRDEVMSDSCRVCIDSGDVNNWGATCWTKGKRECLYPWEQVHRGLSAWRAEHC